MSDRETQTRTEPASGRQRLARAAAVVGVACALSWPALLNHFPLIFPDELGYVRQSTGMLAKLMGDDVPYLFYMIMRSEIYTATMAPFRHADGFWALVGLQGLLTAWVLWLVVRSLGLRRPLLAYGVIALGLTLVSELAWYIAAPMPDILGAILYLSFFLMVPLRGALRAWERGVLGVVMLWALTAHATHLMLGAGLLVLFGLFWLARWPGMAGRGRALACFAGLLVVAVAAQLTVHYELYQETTLFGRPPAFIMARLLGDGPARLYLQGHCATLTWLICKDVDHLPTTDNEFLWSTTFFTASGEGQAELRREQMPLLRATLRAYPRQQLAISLRNFGRSLITLGPKEYVSFDGFPKGYLDYSVPGLAAKYAPTLQIRDALPQDQWRRMQLPLLIVSLLAVLGLLPWVWRRRQYPLLALSAIVFFILPANAFLNGVISGVYPRYQGRVAWMMAFLASLMIYAVLSARAARQDPQG